MTIKIDQALTQWFLAGNFGLPIAHENQTYTPAGQSPWCEIRVIPNDVTAATIRHSSETDGVFRVILRYPQGTGAIAAKQKADQILAHFRLGTRLSFDGQRVNLTSTKRDQGVADDGWYSLVLTVGYRVFLTRQAVVPPTPPQIPPAPLSATVLADGVTLRLVFDAAITSGSATLGMSRSIGTIISGAYSGINLDLVVPTVYVGDSAGSISFDANTGTLAGAGGFVASFGPLAIINNSTQVAPITCAYPLDDDGTLAGAFGYAYAGPAVGADSQSMDYTSAGAGGAILLPSGAFTTARFSRPASVYSVAEATSPVGDIGSLVLVVSDTGGSFVNALVIDVQDEGDLLAVTVASDGSVNAYINGAPAGASANWLNPIGQTTVGATDKYALALGATAVGSGQITQMTLRTKSTAFTGAYDPGATDPCGNAI